MRLSPRMLIPAVLVAGAVALPGAGSADPPATHVFCPAPESDWFLTDIVVAPAAADKDNNNPPQPASNNPDDYVDNLVD